MHTASRHLTICLLLSFGAPGCQGRAEDGGGLSDSATPPSDSDDGPWGGDGDGNQFDVGNGGDSGDVPDGGSCDCVNVRDGIYVLDSNAPPSVWFYDPPQNRFERVGALGCPAPAGTVANSMAIARNGYAWLNYYQTGVDPNGSDWVGRMYRAPLGDLGNCQSLDYAGGRGTWFLMGMGYATRGTSSCDNLYLYNSDKYTQYPNFESTASALAIWNAGDGDANPLGATNYPVAELTGTGDGRLYGFATVGQNRSNLVQFDKSDASEIEVVPLDGLDITNAFAFAFWGGDVYFFTQIAPGMTNSKVTRLDYDGNDGGGLRVIHESSGLHITGAGVSTCASFIPPG